MSKALYTTMAVMQRGSHASPVSGARRVGSTTKGHEVMPEREMFCGGERLMDEFMRVVAVEGQGGEGRWFLSAMGYFGN